MGWLVVIVIAVFIGLIIRQFNERLGSVFFQRLRWMPVLLIPISMIIFGISKAAPGDPVDVIAGPSASQEVRERVAEELGLNRPIYEQYADFMISFPSGDWGDSYKYQRPVTELMVERGKVSAVIGGPVSILALIGIPLGLFMAWRKGTWLDTAFFVNTQVYIAIPSIIMIQFLILLFAVKLGWLPAGWQGGWEGIFTKSAFIPIATLALGSVAGMAHFTRTIALKIVDEPYIRAAKAKGLSTLQILRRYVLSNVRSPLITVLAPVAFTFFEGSFFVETIYGIPGLSRFLIDSVFARDYPVIISVAFFSAALGLVINLIQDLLYHTDPRIDLAE